MVGIVPKKFSGEFTTPSFSKTYQLTTPPIYCVACQSASPSTYASTALASKRGCSEWHECPAEPDLKAQRSSRDNEKDAGRTETETSQIVPLLIPTELKGKWLAVHRIGRILSECVQQRTYRTAKGNQRNEKRGHRKTSPRVVSRTEK